MNQNLQLLHEYPFGKLKTLLQNLSIETTEPVISLAIGEPQHAPPEAVLNALVADLGHINQYPSTQGSEALRQSIAAWLTQRYQLSDAVVNPESNVLPVVGTREALFAIAQTVVDVTNTQLNSPPLVIMPSPFYQIYEGAAIMAGAEPLYLPCEAANHYLPDLDAVSDSEWNRCQLVYICNPSNPTGVIPPASFYQRLLELADRFDFVVASDECYSEIYYDEHSPPLGLLEVCQSLGRNDFARCLVFNSLSKRSNLAGMRSGFVAGCDKLIAAFLKYRTYHGSAMPLHHQSASVIAWSDEAHVQVNRQLYREKMDRIVPMLQSSLGVEIPAAGFCLWAKTPIDDELFTQKLFSQQQVRVLPGQYLARMIDGHNPGLHYIRMALVQPIEDCVQAAERIVKLVANL
jgi:N-succinyldiaminopimelate aminotransferase